MECTWQQVIGGVMISIPFIVWVIWLVLEVGPKVAMKILIIIGLVFSWLVLGMYLLEACK